MRFGISLFGHHPLAKSPAENFQSILTLARAAAENGFELFSAGHHYMVRSFQKFQPLPAMARVSAEVNDQVFLNILDLLPLNHPIRLAEQLATLDAMTNGRVVFTAVLGYSDHEFKNFGIPKKQRLGRYIEAIDIIKRLWTEDDVTFHGEYYSLDHVTINPKPVQDPHPPIWVTADADKGVARAARIGDAWLMSNHTLVDTLEKQLEIFEANRPPNFQYSSTVDIRRPLMRILSVAETKQQAIDEARPAIEATWKKYYEEFNQAAEMDDPNDFTQDFDSLWRGRFLIGTPEECVRQIEGYQKRLAVDLLIVSIGGPLERKVRNIEFFGQEVVPHFKKS